MAGKQEIKTSLEVDFSKVEQKLREADRRAKEEDQKAEAVERRTARLVERMKEAQASARELESRVGGRIEDMVKDFGKFSVKSILFDTFASYSGISASEAGPLAGIAAAGVATGVATLNPIFGLLAAMGKSIDFLRDAQKEHQRQIDDLRREADEREAREEELRQGIRDRNEEARFQEMKDEEEVKTEVSREENELLKKTWLLMGGGDN